MNDHRQIFQLLDYDKVYQLAATSFLRIPDAPANFFGDPVQLVDSLSTLK